MIVRRPTPTTRPPSRTCSKETPPTSQSRPGWATAPMGPRRPSPGSRMLAMAKLASATGRAGRFGKDDFTVDLETGEVTCPAGNTAAIRTAENGSGLVDFAAQCTGCPLRASCTTSAAGRTVTTHPREDLLRSTRPHSAIPTGRRPTPAPGPKRSPRSPTSCAALGEDGEPGSAARPASRPMPTPAPRPSTGPVSPPSESTSSAGRGPPPRRERRSTRHYSRPSPPLHDPRTPENPPKDTGESEGPTSSRGTSR